MHISLSPHSTASFDLPAAVMATLPSKLCGSLLLIKTVHRALVGSDARPWFNSTRPLMANLTTLQLCTICNGVTREVSLKELDTCRYCLLAGRGPLSPQYCTRPHRWCFAFDRSLCATLLPVSRPPFPSGASSWPASLPHHARQYAPRMAFVGSSRPRATTEAGSTARLELCVTGSGHLSLTNALSSRTACTGIQVCVYGVRRAARRPRLL